MQKIILTGLMASIIVSGIAYLGAEGNYTEPSKSDIASKQQESSAMRMKYYNEYKAKGYDLTSLESYLDTTTTSDGEYWAAFKIIKDKKEIPERREYIAKLSSKGYDVSGFTESVIWDAGKFWETVKMVESMKNTITEPKKVEEKKEEKKTELVKQEYKQQPVMKKEEEKTIVPQKQEEKKAEVTQKIIDKSPVKISSANIDRLKSTMKARIAKLPSDTRDSTLVKLETTLMKHIENARSKNAKLLVARYEVLLSVVQEEMDNIDDEALLNSLFQ